MRLSQMLRTPLLLAIAFAVLSSPLAYRLTRDMFGAWVASAAGCSTPSGVALHALVFLGIAVLLALSSSTTKEGFPSPSPQGPLAIPRPALFNRFTRRHSTKAEFASRVWTQGKQMDPAFEGLDKDLSKWLQDTPAAGGDGSYTITKMMFYQNNKTYDGNGKALAGFTYLYARYEGSMNGEALWFVPTLCGTPSQGCTSGRMRVALYGGKPQMLYLKNQTLSQLMAKKISSTPITTSTPSGSYVPDPSEYRVKVSPPPPTAALPSTYDGPLAINVRRAPIQGYDSVGTLIKLSKPRYWVSTGDFDELFNFVTRDTNIYFQNQADGVWYKLYATGDVTMSFTPGKEMYSTVVLYKHDGKSWIGIPPLKNYNFVMTKIKTSSDPTLLTPAGTTYTFIPAIPAAPTTTTTTPTTPLVLNFVSIPQGTTPGPLNLTLVWSQNMRSYYISPSTLDTLFSVTNREKYVYFQDEKSKSYHKLEIKEPVTSGKLAGKVRATVWKWEGQSFQLIKDNRLATGINMINIIVAPQNFTSVIPRSSTQDINKKIGTTGGAIHPMTPSPQVITVSTGQSPGSLITAPDDFFLTPENFDYDYYRAQAAIKSPTGRVKDFPDALLWSHFQSTGKVEGWAWRIKKNPPVNSLPRSPMPANSSSSALSSDTGSLLSADTGSLLSADTTLDKHFVTINNDIYA